MTSRSAVMRRLRPFLERHPSIKVALRDADMQLARLHHSAAKAIPQLIRPEPRHLTIAVTAHCNLRCAGCGYGRDFMAGEQLPLHLVNEAVADARAAGINTVRFYGGEPLLHPQLPTMVEHANRLGLYTYVTTNGTLLRHRMRPLYEAGLRLLTIGYYGSGEKHSTHTQRGGSFKRLVDGLDLVRTLYGGTVEIQLNFVLMASSCSVEDVRVAWDLCRKYDMFFHVDLVNPIVPFFTGSKGSGLEIDATREADVIRVTNEIIRLKREHPDRVLHSIPFLRSIPDWLLRPEQMEVPCDAYQTLWIGADGTVQICDTALRIGNIKEKPLREFLFGAEHAKAARDGFCLDCPRCLCKIETRIQKDSRSIRRYRHDPVLPSPSQGS